MKLHERLKYAREAKALTQEQVAGMLRRSLRTVQNHESGQNRPPGRMIQAYVDLYGCKYRWLLFGDEEGEDLRENSVPLAGDGDGLWGKTRRDQVEGIDHDVTIFEPRKGRKAAPELGQAVDMLNTVLASRDQVFIQALMSNLIAFSHAAEQQKAYQARISGLEKKCQVLEERVAAQANEISELKKVMKLLEEKLSGFSAPRQDPESKASGET